MESWISMGNIIKTLTGTYTEGAFLDYNMYGEWENELEYEGYYNNE